MKSHVIVLALFGGILGSALVCSGQEEGTETAAERRRDARDVERILSRQDKNSDGQITEDEAPPRLRRAFGYFDVNQDGSLDRIELTEVAKMVRRVREPMADQRKAPETLVPLTDMTAEDLYEGEDGGLYGQGHNSPPKALHAAAQAAIGRIVPRDAEGDPSPDGKICFVSISMSNATMEFSYFKQLADASPQKSPHVTIVDCAQGGQAMAQWAPADARPWQVAERRLEATNISRMQVQTAWVKLANVAPTGTLEQHGRTLEADTIKVLRNAKRRFPNLQIAYLGSRIWAGNATSGLNPEPYAYESAFVVRWLIQRQMRGDAELDIEQAPLLLWGPYLWAEGEQGRQIDDLVWKPADFAGDGVHPSQSGREKVARMLLDFACTDPLARPWFSAK